MDVSDWMIINAEGKIFLFTLVDAKINFLQTFLVTCVSHAFASVHCCLVVTCWERGDLLAFVGNVYYIFVTFPCGILGQVWLLIVFFFPDPRFLSYFPDAFILCFSGPKSKNSNF